MNFFDTYAKVQMLANVCTDYLHRKQFYDTYGYYLITDSQTGEVHHIHKEPLTDKLAATLAATFGIHSWHRYKIKALYIPAVSGNADYISVEFRNGIHPHHLFVIPLPHTYSFIVTNLIRLQLSRYEFPATHTVTAEDIAWRDAHAFSDLRSVYGVENPIGDTATYVYPLDLDKNDCLPATYPVYVHRPRGRHILQTLLEDGYVRFTGDWLPMPYSQPNAKESRINHLTPPDFEFLEPKIFSDWVPTEHEFAVLR